MTNLCGHDRRELLCVLRWAVGDDTRNQTKVHCGCGGACCVIYNDLLDPAKLAEMLAERGRELGFAPFDEERWDDGCPLPAIDTYKSGNGITIVMWFEWGIGPRVLREFIMSQSRAILLQWLQLPDVPCDASKGDEFGQCDECGDGIDPPSDADDLALSAWESDHPGEQVSLCKFDTRWLCVPCSRDAVREQVERTLRVAI